MTTYHAPITPAARPATTAARRPRRCTADYRWTQPKVIAFLEALATCGKVAEAARAVGMSGTSAYRLRARMASARFDAAFEGARRSGIRARAAASRARQAAASPSPWTGPGIAAMIARERALAQGAEPAAQGAAPTAQGATRDAQGATSPPQVDGAIAQGAGLPHKVPPQVCKVTEFSPGLCNKRSMSPALSRAGGGG